MGVIYAVFDERKERFDQDIDVIWLVHLVLILNEVRIDDVGIIVVEMGENLEDGDISIPYMSVL